MDNALKIRVPEGMELLVGPGESETALVGYRVEEDGTLTLTEFDGNPIDRGLLVEVEEKEPEGEEQEQSMEEYIAGRLGGAA